MNLEFDYIRLVLDLLPNICFLIAFYFLSMNFYEIQRQNFKLMNTLAETIIRFKELEDLVKNSIK